MSRLTQDGPSLVSEQAAGQAQALCLKIRRWQSRQRGRELAGQIAQAQSQGDNESVARLQDQRRREIDLVSSSEPSRKD